VDLGPDIIQCSGESITLNAYNEGCQYLWSTCETTQSIVVSTDGLYWVEVSYEGYTVSDDINITFISAYFASAGEDATIYIGYPPYETQLNASGGVNYSWSPAAGLSDPDIPNPIASPDSTTVYTVTVTDSNGCVSTDEVVVTVNDVRCGSNNDKILICHLNPGNPDNNMTMCLRYFAVAQHLAHGDFLGPCYKNAVIDENPGYEITVSPNPFRTGIHISVQVPESETIVIRLYSAEGQLKSTVQSERLDQGIHHFDLNTGNYATGMYFLQVQSSFDNQIFKLIRN
jgi:hypothetical protein